MGSAQLTLKLSDRLRPWYEAGFMYLLKDSAYTASAPEPARLPTFSPPWDAYLAKANIGAQVIFTYVELAFDLSGQGNPARGGLFREFLQHLAWAGKSLHSFWPLAACAGTELQFDPDMFWAGVHAIGAKYIVCFGQESLKILTGAEHVLHNPFTLNNITVYAFADLEQILTMLPHERHLIVDPLRSLPVS